jgi:hypothetical protein
VEVKADGTQTTIGSGIGRPRGVAVDRAGDVFIAATDGNQVLEVTPDGTQTTLGTGLFLPYGVAVDGSGDVFIADTGNDRVVEVTALGTQTTVGSEFLGPTGVAVDGSGDIFIANSAREEQGAPNNDVVEVTAGVTVTVAPATLTITAKDASRVYATTNPVFTDSITGFVNGQSAGVVSGSPVLGTTATLDSPPGHYRITVGRGNLMAANYSFELVNATLTVTPPPLVTLSKVKDVFNDEHQLTEILVNFSGPVNAKEADETAIYHLATPGTGGSSSARNAGTIDLLSAVYDAAADTVTLTLKKPYSLSRPIKLTISGTPPAGLRDSFGRLIDGADTGHPGTSAVAVIRRSGVIIR